METFLKIVLYLFIFAFVFALFGWLTMLLWNWLMPIIFGLPTITFIQAIGLQVLTGLLIRGIDVTRK